MTAIQLTVNGERVTADVEPRLHLGDFLRERLRLTGTHLGCEHGVCGACTVLVDGVPIRSCIVQAVACDGQDIRSIEGLDDDPVAAELRDAFRREHGLQCGFCTPGMLIAARDIVLRVPHADEKRIRHELAGNLCRCTGYVGIVNAVRSVIDARRERGAAAEPVRAAIAIAKAQPAHAAKAPAREAAPTAVPAAMTSSAAAPAAGRDGWTRFAESFVIEKSPREVWDILSDFRRVASCLPGAELTEHSDRHLKGRMNVKLGPIRAAFSGSAEVELDPATMTGRIRGAGSDSGSGSRTKANAVYAITSEAAGAAARVSLNVEYNLQGPLAQFSRSGLAQDLGRRLVAEFANNLNASFGAAGARAGAAPAALNASGILWATLKHRLLAWLGRLTGRKD